MSSTRIIAWLTTGRGILCLFVVGFAIRVVLAAISDGLAFDVGLFRQWSNRMVERGPSGFYGPGYFADYPPGYLYVLWVLGQVSRALTGGAPTVLMLKLPAILADLGTAFVAMLLVARMTPAGAAHRWVRSAAAAAILFNPGLVLVSAVWGQVDSILALGVMAAIYLMTSAGSSRPRLLPEVGGAIVMAVVLVTKPQAIFALPGLAVALTYRHLAGRGTARGVAYSLVRLALLVVVSGAVVAAMFAPFGLSPIEVPAFYREAGSVYQFTSLWAFNLWGVVGFYRPDSGPEAVSLAGVAALHLGVIAFACLTLGFAARAWGSLAAKVDATAVATFAAVAVTCAGFAVLTRSHERYLYLAVAALAPFVGIRPLRWALAGLSVSYFLNVHFVYVLFSHGSSPPGNAWTIQPLYDMLYGATRDAGQRKVLSAFTTIFCLTLAFCGWRWLKTAAATLNDHAGHAAASYEQATGTPNGSVRTVSSLS